MIIFKFEFICVYFILIVDFILFVIDFFVVGVFCVLDGWVLVVNDEFVFIYVFIYV